MKKIKNVGDIIYLYHILGLSQRKIAKLYNVNQSTISKLMKRNNIKVRKNEREIDFNKINNLSYILGVIKGDGWILINRKKKRYVIGLTVISKKFALEFLNNLKQIGLKPRMIIKKNKYYQVVANSKKLCLWIKNLDLKKFLKSKKSKIQFLKGFYESEGSCYDRIRIFNTNEKLMKFVFDILRELNFNPTMNCYNYKRENSKPIYVISINRKNEIKNFFT